MDKETREYFTTGELASLYGIPKQTLLYYDRNKLLVPEFIKENGYRYYSVSQYLTLEIILNMRKLDIPVHTIKDYLADRRQEKFIEILQKKEAACTKLIEAAKLQRDSLHQYLLSLENLPSNRLEQIELRFEEKLPLFFSRPLYREMSVHERVQTLSQHNMTAFSPKHFKEFCTGWVITAEDFHAKIFNNTRRYFTPATLNSPAVSCEFRPAGLYLTLSFQGTYYQQIIRIHDKLQTFLARNHLQIIGDIYILPLKSHWLTEDPAAYINKISLPVKYQD